MNLIWATRGRRWGFRFLLDGGYPDPLPLHEEAFSGVADQREVCRRIGERVALRFPDPLLRTDQAGRVIPHYFVTWGPAVQGIASVEDGLQEIWPLVAAIYERVWDDKLPPSAEAIRSAVAQRPSRT